MKKILALCAALLIALTACAPATPAPTPDPPEPPSEEELLQAALEVTVAEMTLEEKVGQMFFVRHPETGGMEDLERLHLGGYLLFARDFQNRDPETLGAMLDTYQQTADWPLFIGVDEEGGAVVRASRYSAFREERFEAPRKILEQGGLEALGADAAEKSAFLRELGINVNYAPVCDLSGDPGDYMYGRSLSGDPSEAANGVRAITTAMAEQEMGFVLKHFPGYGANADTHTGMARDSRPYEEFLERDFVPFRAGMEQPGGCVLVSHTIVESMDPELPASLSPKVHEILREELGFDGVILTDDLVMEAITEAYGTEQAAVLAVLAGNDMLVATDYETGIRGVLAAVEAGTIPESRIDESVLRILRWAVDLGIWEPQ